MKSIDLNCDLGELDALIDVVQPQLLACVTSANVCCGAHAGSAELARRTIQQAAARGVVIGAHPGYEDRAHFGRIALDIPAQELEDSIARQVALLVEIAVHEDARVAYVKPHGALYNRAARDPLVATTIARAVARVDASLALMGLANSVMIDVWREFGCKTLEEAFADRAYEADGTLRSRQLAGAVLSVEDAAAQAVAIATQAPACPLKHVDTICLHGDADDAVARAQAVRAALEAAGVVIESWQNSCATR